MVEIARQSLFFASGDTILDIPGAAGVLYPFTGRLLHPIIAAAALAASPSRSWATPSA